MRFSMLTIIAYSIVMYLMGYVLAASISHYRIARFMKETRVAQKRSRELEVVLKRALYVLEGCAMQRLEKSNAED